MNEYFCSVGKDLAKEIEYVPNPLLSGDHKVNPDKNASDLRTLNIRDAIGKIKTSECFVTDNIFSQGRS